MVSRKSPPDPRILLPPILACLPTAFVSPRPPPALLPLLSPILQQRVQIHSQGASQGDSWLPLLCWRPQQAAKLPDLVGEMQIEPHPVSGEVEIDDVEAIRYRRLDEETLHALVQVSQFGLAFIYVWCEGSGWKLAELRALEDGVDGGEWYDSIADADEASLVGRAQSTLSPPPSGTNGTLNGTDSNTGGDNDDEDDYWAAYDRTPGRTPAKLSPAPNTSATGLASSNSNSELEYFARYVAEVQPAMDPHDPTEQNLPPGESTLNGNEIVRGAHGDAPSNAAARYDRAPGSQEQAQVDVRHPRPSSSSSASGSVRRFEEKAEERAQVEVVVKQHISTDVKSLYRLARGAGIDRHEFERLIRTELECLGLMDLDD